MLEAVLVSPEPDSPETDDCKKLMNYPTVCCDEKPTSAKSVS